MSRVEVKTFEIRCDWCNTASVIVTGSPYGGPSLPDGWTAVRVGPCGMTDYYRTDDVCPSCMADENDKEKK